MRAERPNYYENCFHNIQEVWLSPKVDAKKFFNELATAAADSPEGAYKSHSSGILNGMLTIFVPDTQLPKGLLSYSSSEPPYSVKVYSGDVYEAYKQGASIGRDWCPGHVYTGKIQTASRMAQHITCQQPNLWYYSCKWCGKCEYDPNEVNWAAQNDLIDAALLGGNYTGSITRLQFCSVAVKMAEKMLGKSITPAPAGTFTDTDDEYVRKAYAAGITTGSGGGKFSPGGALTRQEMATFLYRSLMYVKKNSDIRYTIYDSKLGNYSDSSKLANWAKEPMTFMNALGLVNGTGGMLSPTAPCTIEQALLVANRSLSADVIGWYQSLGGTEKNAIGSINEGGSKTKRCFYTIPGDISADSTFTQLRYLQSERFWVTGAAQTQDWITRGERAQGDYIRILKMIDPYTGDTLYIQANDFRPIKAD